MGSTQAKKLFFVLVSLVLGFALVASTATTLVCPIPPTGEGEGEVPAEGEGEVQPEPEPEPEPEEIVAAEGEGEVEVPAEGEEIVIEEEVATEGEGEEGVGLSDLSVGPGTLLLEASVASGTVDVTNAGSGTLSWTATSTNTNVTITPSEGSGPATVTIEGAASLFTGADTTVTVTFTNAENATDTADVKVTLLGPGVSTGLRNVALGTTVYLVASADHEYSTVAVQGVSPQMLKDGLPDVTDPTVSAYNWEMVSAPAGSKAPEAFAAAFSSTTDARVTFVPDAVGQYTVQCTMTQDGTDYSYEQTINVSTFVGVGNCVLCHSPGGIAPDMYTPWSGTKHATKLQREIDGLGSSHYGEGCIKCHTVGYNLLSSANNGGFDDVQAETGWVFPATLQAGNYDAMPDDLKNLANIQCENCHGPGGNHMGNTSKIDKSLNAEVCNSCHDSLSSHPRGQEWKNSGHGDENSEAFGEHMSSSTTCVRCHSGAGYVAKVEGVADADLPLGKQIITCATCHDPHDATNPNQLRRYGSVDLAPYETDEGGAGINNFDNVGAAATCMYCHNGRRDPSKAAENRFPHGGNTAADMLLGVNGVEYGSFVANSSHTTATANDGYCVRCHMAPTPASDQPGYLTVGAHSFAMTSENDNGTPDDPSDDTEVENIGACAECHPDLTEFNRPASGDWDGQNGIQGVQDEVRGLMDLVKEQAVALGAVETDGHWDLTAVAAENLTKVQNAVWNWTFVENDRSFGIHNTNYTVVLLQKSYKDLTGVDVLGADIRN